MRARLLAWPSSQKGAVPSSLRMTQPRASWRRRWASKFTAPSACSSGAFGGESGHLLRSFGCSTNSRASPPSSSKALFSRTSSGSSAKNGALESDRRGASERAALRHDRRQQVRLPGVEGRGSNAGRPKRPDDGRHGERAGAADSAVPGNGSAPRGPGIEEQPPLHELLVRGSHRQSRNRRGYPFKNTSPRSPPGFCSHRCSKTCYDLRGKPQSEVLMAYEKLLKRITARPDVFGGKPIIRGMRISVELILSLLAQGEAEEAILQDYPDLEAEDIRACIAYAHAVIARDSLDAIEVTK